MSNALLALLALLLGMIGWFLRQMYDELKHDMNGLRDDLGLYQRQERRRNNVFVATVMALQMELHPDDSQRVREVMLKLLDGDE